MPLFLMFILSAALSFTGCGAVCPNVPLNDEWSVMAHEDLDLGGVELMAPCSFDPDVSGEEGRIVETGEDLLASFHGPDCTPEVKEEQPGVMAATEAMSAGKHVIAYRTAVNSCEQSASIREVYATPGGVTKLHVVVEDRSKELGWNGVCDLKRSSKAGLLVLDDDPGEAIETVRSNVPPGACNQLSPQTDG